MMAGTVVRAPFFRVLVSTAMLGAALAGCVNTPDALTLTLSPEKQVFAPGEPIVISADLCAVEGPVCTHWDCQFGVEMRRVDSDVQFRRPAQTAFCGTGLGVALPVYPILVSAALLDVGDLSGRYVVLAEGEERTLTLELRPVAEDLRVRVHEGRPGESEPAQVAELAPGRYAVRAELSSTPVPRGLRDFLPAPLLWRPYDHPVVGETEIVVGGLP